MQQLGKQATTGQFFGRMGTDKGRKFGRVQSAFHKTEAFASKSPIPKKIISKVERR